MFLWECSTADLDFVYGRNRVGPDAAIARLGCGRGQLQGDSKLCDPFFKGSFAVRREPCRMLSRNPDIVEGNADLHIVV